METTVLTNENIETFDPNAIKLPYILKDKVLMAPGIWNDTYYDSDAITKAFENTDWNDKEIRALFYDHEDRKSRDWIGYIENPRLIGDKVLGDLHIFNKDAAIQIGIAKMKCGISPKVHGNEDKDRKMSDMAFLNFSIVTNPACKKAYINLNDKSIEKEVKNMEKMAVSDQPVEVTEELKKKEEKPKEKEKAPEEEKKEEMTDSDFASFLALMDAEQLSEYTDFVKSFLKKNKGASIKDAAKAYKSQKKMFEQFESLSEDELIEQINCLTSILKKKKYPYPYEEKEKKMSEEIGVLTDKVKELESKLNAPDKKTVKALSEEPQIVAQSQNMWDFLRTNAKVI